MSLSKLSRVFHPARAALFSTAAVLGVATILGAHPALACSVCAGDPGAPITQGVQAGVLVLLGVVGTVLLGFASVLVFWMRRAANLETLSRAVEEPRRVYPLAAH